jgi:hypothetical protein
MIKMAYLMLLDGITKRANIRAKDAMDLLLGEPMMKLKREFEGLGLGNLVGGKNGNGIGLLDEQIWIEQPEIEVQIATAIDGEGNVRTVLLASEIVKVDIIAG